MKEYLISQKFRGTLRDQKNKNSHKNCLITYMFTGLLFTTEDMKKNKLQGTQRNEMLSLYCTAFGFISKK